MNKLKKSLSVLLTLVMLFTTLCFFVLPETGIKANAARAEIQGGYTESVNPVTFSVASNTLKVDVNNVSTTVTANALSFQTIVSFITVPVRVSSFSSFFITPGRTVDI